MKESYTHNLIKSRSYMKTKQGSNTIVSLPSSMNLLDQHIKCIVSGTPRTGSHVLRRQQAMLLMESSKLASHNSI